MENLDVPQEKAWEELLMDLEGPKEGEQLKQCGCTWVCAPCAFPSLRGPVPASLGDRTGLKCASFAASLSQLKTPKI